VWIEPELAAYLAVALEDRLQAVWMLVATTGMRRGELCGLRWTDVDLDARRMTISQTRTLADHEQVVGEPKTAAGARTIALHPEAVAALRAWRKAQREERLLIGAGWQETGLVATESTGAGVHPQRLTRPFTSMVATAALRLHDVRHAYVTAALRAGVPVKVLSERIGHSDVKVTMSIYQHVTQADDEAAALLSTSRFLPGCGPSCDHSVTSGLPLKEKAQVTGGGTWRRRWESNPGTGLCRFGVPRSWGSVAVRFPVFPGGPGAGGRWRT